MSQSDAGKGNSSGAGKGDRPRKVDRKKWDATWARINQEKDNENINKKECISRLHEDK